MPRVLWRTDEIVVLVYFQSRKVCHEACRKLIQRRSPICRFEWTSRPITSVIRENLRTLLIMAALFRGFLLLVVLHKSQGMLLLLSDPRCGSLRPVALHPVLLRHPLDSFLKCPYLGRIPPRVL